MTMHPSDEFENSTPIEHKNKYYTDDIERTMRYTRLLFEFLGLWPMIVKENKSSRFEKIFGKFLIVVCLIAPAFVFVPTSLHAIMRETNLIVILTLVGAVSFFFANFFKYVFIVLRIDTVKLCVEHVESDWLTIDNAKDCDIMTRNARVGHDLTVICGTFMYATGTFYHAIMPLCMGKTTNEFNETVRPLVYPGFDIFVDSQSTPFYEIIFCTICLSAFVAFNVTTLSCNLAAVFVSHACGQIDIVMSRLENLVNERDNDNNVEIIDERISMIVRYHVRVLRFSSRIEQVLREICLIEIVASTLVICVNEYCLIKVWNNSDVVAIITYSAAVASLSFNIFIFCHIGELLNEQCLRVEKAAYMIEWYRLPGKTSLALIMIIIMSNYSRKITAGGMFELSIRTFGDIMKTTLMYMNLLREVAD